LIDGIGNDKNLKKIEDDGDLFEERLTVQGRMKEME
jgi:hypothetical protein